MGPKCEKALESESCEATTVLRVTSSSETINNHASFIWSVADLLCGDYKQSDYGKVVLPLTVLRRFDCVLSSMKDEMLDAFERVKDRVENFAPILD